VEGMFFS